MKTVLPFALVCLPVCLTAQIAVEATARTPIGVATSSPATLVGVPAGPLTLPLFLNTVIGTPLARFNLSASPGFDSARVLLTSVVVAYGNEAGMTPSTAAVPTFGAVDLVVSFVGTPGLTGNVHSSISRNVVPSVPTSVVNQCAIDVGNDGTFEATAAGQMTVPVRMDASGHADVRIVVENHGYTVPGLLVSSATLAVQFVADPIANCIITPYGAGCGAMQSSGTSVQLGTARAISLLGSGSAAQSMVLSAFGLQNSGPVLPGGCALLTDATFVMPLLADRFGYVSQTLNVPATAAGTLYHQFIALDPAMRIAASNGLDITCAP